MIKLPLRRPIILFTKHFVFLCKVIHAGKDLVTCVDCYERVVSESGVFYFYLGDSKLYIDRKNIIGYKRVDVEDLLAAGFPDDLLADLIRDDDTSGGAVRDGKTGVIIPFKPKRRSNNSRSKVCDHNGNSSNHDSGEHNAKPENNDNDAKERRE